MMVSDGGDFSGVPLNAEGRKVGSTWDPAKDQAAGNQCRGYAGNLRKNGVPYSENASLVEYFDRFSESNGDTWLVVTSIVTDRQYLTQPFVTTTHFKKIPDHIALLRR